MKFRTISYVIRLAIMTCWRRYALSSNRMLCIFRIEWWVGHELENILSIGASARLHQRMVRTIRRPDITKYLEIYVRAL